MKRILSILLVLALAFTLALPAFAEDPDPAMPVITVQPEGVRVHPNRTFVLSVEAYIPNGDPIRYLWYRDDGTAFASAAEVRRSESTLGTYNYYVVVINNANPEYSVTSETVQVEVYSAWDDLTFFQKVFGPGLLIGYFLAIYSVLYTGIIGTFLAWPFVWLAGLFR